MKGDNLLSNIEDKLVQKGAKIRYLKGTETVRLPHRNPLANVKIKLSKSLSMFLFLRFRIRRQAELKPDSRKKANASIVYLQYFQTSVADFRLMIQHSRPSLIRYGVHTYHNHGRYPVRIENHLIQIERVQVEQMWYDICTWAETVFLYERDHK